MPEEEFKTDNLNNSDNKPEYESQIDDFPKTTKLLNTKLKDKKDKILSVLEDNELKKLFEETLSNPEKRQKIINELLESDNTEGVILSNLPEGYVYNVSNNEVVKTEVKKSEDYILATTMDQKTEEADQKTEEADQKTEEADQDKKETIESQKSQKEYEIMMKAIGKRAELIEKYKSQNLDEKTNKNSDNYQNVKQQLESNGVLNQLRESNHDEEFINNYILVQTTLQELKSNPTNYEQSDISFFDKVVKNLDNACNIPDTSLDSFSSENISQTRKELFNSDVGNESLVNARELNKNSHDYSEVFPEKTEEEMIQTYGKFLPNDSKNLLNNYIQHLNDNTLNEYRQTDECKDLLKAIDEIKTSVEDKTKNLVEELCIISQIKGMYMCMGEGDDFSLNKANDIQSENGVLTLNGNIDGVDFSIRQDTNDPNARLQTSQKLVKSEDGNTFTIGGKDRFVDSNFILPSQDEIFQLAVESVNSDGILDGASDINEYQELLQEEFMKKADELYKDTKYVHHYMKNQVKGEKIIDDSLGLISKINPSILNNKTLLDSINQSTNKDLYDFLKILNFNIENSTSHEKDKLIKCIDVIQNIPTLYKERMNGVNNTQSNYPPIIKNYLENQAWISDGNENSKLKLVYDLFSKYNEYSMEQRSSERSDYNQSKEGTEGVSSKIIINDLYRDLVEFTTSGQSEVAVRWENENKEQQDRQDAKNIEKAIENMPDGDWS